jgi:hypothetical protein
VFANLVECFVVLSRIQRLIQWPLSYDDRSSEDIRLQKAATNEVELPLLFSTLSTFIHSPSCYAEEEIDFPFLERYQ